jgi:predicted phosphate transport protein (TIGR00153 family)
MFRFFFKKQNALEELLKEYIQSIQIAQENFLHAMETYFQTGKCCPDFSFLVEETHKAESRGDDIQEKIIMLMYEKALIPEFRGDMLTLLESIDEVPDQLDRVLNTIETQKIFLHDFVKPDFHDLVKISMSVCTLMLEGVHSLIRPTKDIGKILFKADQMESQGDHIERRILTRIFESDWDPLQKILLRDLAHVMGDIADHAVHACRQVNLITLKRLT